MRRAGRGVINAADADSLYEIPLVVHDEGSTRSSVICCASTPASPTSRVASARRQGHAASRAGRIGIIGKYVTPGRCLSVGCRVASPRGIHEGARVEIEWIQAEEVEGCWPRAPARPRWHRDPWRFRRTGRRRARSRPRYAREHDIPCLGLCLGMQVMTIEYRPQRAGMAGANSSEFDPQTPFPVIDSDGVPARRDRQGRHHAPRRLCGRARAGVSGCRRPTATIVSERHRHRYEFNPRYRGRFDGPTSDARARAPMVVWSSSSSCQPPVLGRHPGPPRVQEPSRTALRPCSRRSWKLRSIG